MRSINLIVIHCADTPASMDIGAREIDRWHRERGFLQIGYHWVIRRDGTLERGRAEFTPGAHVEGHNASSIGVCMVGGKSAKGTPENNFTENQWSTLTHTVNRLLKTYPGAKVLGHRDLNKGKACPCFDVSGWLKSTQS